MSRFVHLSPDAAFVFVIAFVIVSLIWFAGPKRARPDSKWFGTSCLALAVLAATVRFELGDIASAAAVAVAIACYVAGILASRATRDR